MQPSPEFLILIAIIGALSAIVLWLRGDICELAKRVRQIDGDPDTEEDIRFERALAALKETVSEPASARELLERRP